MNRFVSGLAVLCLLGACSGDGTNPFQEPVVEDDNPSTANSKFLFNIEDKLTMNDVSYDADDNVILINNLPFDGPSQRYLSDRTQGGVGLYKSIQTATTGQIQHFAVFMQNEDMQVAAAAGVNWIDYGYAGANVKRNTYRLPGGVGEYVYLGSYGGVRNRGDRSGTHIVTGDVRLLLDIFDFDENGDGEGDEILEGAIAGTIRNRIRTDAETGAVITRNLPTVSLTVVQYDPTTLSFDGGIAVTNGSDGIWEGFIAGADGGSIGAYVNLEGTAEIQTVRYEVITWTDAASGTSGEVSGYGSTSANDFDTIFDLVDAGVQVPLLVADTSGIPATATRTVTIEEILFESDGDARETGVLLTDQVPTP